MDRLPHSLAALGSSSSFLISWSNRSPLCYSRRSCRHSLLTSLAPHSLRLIPLLFVSFTPFTRLAERYGRREWGTNERRTEGETRRGVNEVGKYNRNSVNLLSLSGHHLSVLSPPRIHTAFSYLVPTAQLLHVSFCSVSSFRYPPPPPLSSTTRRLSSARGSFTRASLTPTRRLRRLVQRRVESDGGPWEWQEATRHGGCKVRKGPKVAKFLDR